MAHNTGHIPIAVPARQVFDTGADCQAAEFSVPCFGISALGVVGYLGQPTHGVNHREVGQAQDSKMRAP